MKFLWTCIGAFLVLVPVSQDEDHEPAEPTLTTQSIMEEVFEEDDDAEIWSDLEDWVYRDYWGDSEEAPEPEFRQPAPRPPQASLEVLVQQSPGQMGTGAVIAEIAYPHGRVLLRISEFKQLYWSAVNFTFLS
jgi:hypothetical protein